MRKCDSARAENSRKILILVLSVMVLDILYVKLTTDSLKSRFLPTPRAFDARPVGGGGVLVRILLTFGMEKLE